MRIYAKSAIADLDNDGDLDVVGRTDDTVFWYSNTDAVFSEREVVISGYNGRFRDFKLVDLDGDADLDILAVGRVDANEGEHEIVWYENNLHRIVGDANCDGVFDSLDFVQIFTIGEYEDGIVNNSTYGDGDFNGDGEFDSSDFVFLFTHGDFNQAATFSRADYSSAIQSNEPDLDKRDKWCSRHWTRRVLI